jgi:hypothetical protein
VENSHMQSLEGDHEGNRSFEVPRLRWEDNIKIYLKEIG